MGHKNKKSLVCQVSENLKLKLAIGKSKHNDKINNVSSKEKIYSYGTYNAYLQQCIQFVKWCKVAHKCKSLNECRKYADEYLKTNIDRGLSAYTLKLQVAALVEKDGQYYIHIKNGKGGRERYAEICGTKEEIAFVVQKMKNAEDNKVFIKIPYTDIHAMRAAYANRIYKKYARQKSEYKKERLIMYHNRVIKTYTSKNIDIKNNLEYYDYSSQTGYSLKPGYKDVKSAYYCRQDKKHICYDRLALLKCSQNLGHNRACIVADHYLY